jgi:hypothetical protein
MNLLLQHCPKQKGLTSHWESKIAEESQRIAWKNEGFRY